MAAQSLASSSSQTSTQAPAQTGFAMEGGTKSKKDKSNAAAVDKLTSGNGAAAPPMDLGAVKDGSSFVSAASKAVEALLPGPGSFANLLIAAKLPIYSSGAMTAFLEPRLTLQAAKTDKDKLEVTVEAVFGVMAQAGLSGDGWWPKFLTYVKAYAKGSLKIVGDNATEVFQEFMLTLRMILEGACDAAGAPSEITEAMANGVMAKDTRDATVRGMDQDDGVTAAIGGGVEVGAQTSLGDGKASADIEFSKTIGNSNGDDVAEVTSKTTLSLKGELELKKLGLKVQPGLTFVFQGGELTQWYFSLNALKELTLENFSAMALMGAEWAQEFVNAMSNMIANAGKKDKKLAQVSNLVSGLAVGPEALKYTAFGDSLKSACKSPQFQGKMGMMVELSLGGQVGWTKGKGLDLKVALASANTWTLGKENETPIFIQARSGDTIVSFTYNKADGAGVTS